MPLSQQAFAELLGVSLPSVSAWERGKTVPRRMMAQRIDETLRAEGALMAAFGYVSQSPAVDDPSAALRKQVAAILDNLVELRSQVAAVAEAVERVVRQAPPTDGEASEGQ